MRFEIPNASEDLRISVIIPVFNEERTIVAAVEAVRQLGPEELIVVDGASSDRTRDLVVSSGSTVVSTTRGRARQMNAGAKLARGDVLLFLHADTFLPASALEDIRRALADPCIVGGRFDVSLDSDRWIFKAIGVLISLRSRLSRVATGDQAIFVRRQVFEQIGGYPDIPLMEDVWLSRTLKHLGKFACLTSRVVTSARRWNAEGVRRTILKMWTLKVLYLLGVSPFRLKRFYDDRH